MEKLFVNHKKQIELAAGRKNLNPVFLNVDNVAEWLEQKHSSGEEIRVVDEDMDYLPWDSVWVEFRHNLGDGDKSTIGILVEKNGSDEWVHLHHFLKIMGKDERLHYTVWCRTSQKGTKIKAPSGVDLKFFPKKEIKYYSDFTRWGLTIVQYSMRFLSCNNVTTIDEPPSKIEQARRKRKNKPPQVTYKVLKVEGLNDSPRKARRYRGKSESEGEVMPLHICRGHFKTYTKDNPRFGRDVGTFWCPMHTRGSKKNGEVHKSYKIV
jgi:hypothetical protein